MRVAKTFLGVKERGYNRGDEVDFFNRTTGIAYGSSWCMAFVYSVHEIAYKSIGKKNPLYRTGSVSLQLKKANDAGNRLRVISMKDIGAALLLKKGAVLCHKQGAQRVSDVGRLWSGHTGIFVTQSGSRITTIEGNTSSGSRGSQRDGNGVYSRTRSFGYWLAAIEVME